MDILAERIKILREKHGYTQQEVADKLQISLSGYRKFEQGQRDINIHVLKDLTSLYEVSSDYLLGIANSTYNLQRMSLDIVLAQTDMYSSGMQYEMLKSRQGEDDFSTLHAQRNYYNAQGHYQKLLYEYMISYFQDDHNNPNDDYFLGKLFPLVYSTERDLFSGVSVYARCNDGTDLGKVKYFTGGVQADQEYAMEKANNYIQEMKQLFKMI